MPVAALPITDRLILNGRSVDGRISESLTSLTYAHGLDQAATLTMGLHDPERLFLRSPLATERVTVRLDNAVYVLVQVSKSGPDLTLTFEDQYVNALRRVKGALKMARSRISRAGFARRLALDPMAAGYVSGAGLGFWAPEYQPRYAKTGRTRTNKPLPPGQPDLPPNVVASTLVVPDVNPGAGGSGNAFDSSAQLTVKGFPADQEQRDNAAVCMAKAAHMTSSARVLVAMLETIIVESTMHNYTGGDRDSVGLFQQRPSQGWTGLRNREEATRQFMVRAIKYAADYPNLSSGELAQKVQGSAHPERYDLWEKEAKKWLAAWLGELSPDTDSSGTGQGYEFSRGVDETSWTAIKRLADDLRWRAFVRQGTVYFTPDAGLLNQPVAMRFSEESDAVYSVDFDWDSGKRSGQATVAGTWSPADLRRLEPGELVVLEGLGVAEGKWLISDIAVDLLGDGAATVEVTRPQPDLPEPPEEDDGTGTKRPRSDVMGTVSAAGSAGSRSVAWAAQFLGKPYHWAGGHVAGVPAMVKYGNDQLAFYAGGFDCSGLVRCAWAQQGVDVGGNTYDMVRRAGATGVPHGYGTTPPGGWQAGDIYLPSDHHVVMMTGDGDGAIEAPQTGDVIKFSDRPGAPYFWARYEGASA